MSDFDKHDDAASYELEALNALEGEPSPAEDDAEQAPAPEPAQEPQAPQAEAPEEDARRTHPSLFFSDLTFPLLFIMTPVIGYMFWSYRDVSPALNAVGWIVIGGMAVLMLWRVLDNQMTTLELTDNGFRFREGIINQNSYEVRVQDIRMIRVKRSLLDRMLGIGDLEVYTGGDKPEVVIPGIEDPEAWRRKIMSEE